MCNNKWYTWRECDLELKIKVVARAKRSEFGLVRGERLVVRIGTPPVDGKANAELLKLLASSFGCPRSRVSLLKGDRSRDKLVRITQPVLIPERLRDSLIPCPPGRR